MLPFLWLRHFCNVQCGGLYHSELSNGKELEHTYTRYFLVHRELLQSWSKLQQPWEESGTGSEGQEEGSYVSQKACDFRRSHKKEKREMVKQTIQLTQIQASARYRLAIHSVVPRPAAVASSGSLLEMQNLSSHPGHIEWKIQGEERGNLGFNKPSRRFWCMWS